MVCTICNAHWHGSDHAPPGTSLNETGCHDGVMMDDDEHAEGWQRDVIYPPCPNNPRRCMTCNGTGEAGPEVSTQDDCPACDGTGWADGKVEWPISIADLAEPPESLSAEAIVASIARRMRELRQERGLSLQDVAGRAGISKTHVWQIEQGRTTNPTIATTVGIARALGVSLDHLAGLTTAEPPLHPDAMRIACEVDALLRARASANPSPEV